jgi:hypothetical protein
LVVVVDEELLQAERQVSANKKRRKRNMRAGAEDMIANSFAGESSAGQLDAGPEKGQSEVTVSSNS